MTKVASFDGRVAAPGGVLQPILFMIFLLLPIAKASADNPKPAMCTLKIHATGFRNEKGAADAAVFSSPEGWPEGVKDFVQDASPIAGGQSTISFHVPPGKYSVVVLHDENKNQKMDRNLFGVPEEGFGFSNNPPVLLKAPSFRQASIDVTCPVTAVNIHVIYK